jgi:hypothetical protein
MNAQLTAALAAIIVLLLPAAAQAYYVDISITGAGRVYETTDADELDEHCPDAIEGFASPSNTPTGSLGATCRAGSASGDYGWNWVVRYVAEPAAGYRFDGWHSDGRTNPGPVLCDGANGSSDYSGSACQFATAADLQVRARFVDDIAPQMSSLTGPNQVVNGPASFTFSAASDPTFRLFECRVAGVHEWQTCSSGRTEDPSTGTYTLQVRAVDWSGNRSAESTWTWTVDKVAPETSLTLGPSSTVASTAATFEFSSNESGSFECTLDGSAVGCGSPKTYSGLGQGAHTFSVRARDIAGNYDATPATRTWTVDTVAPETTLAASGPTGSTTATDATFAFSSDDAGATFRCQLDGQPVEPGCTSPRGYTGLAVGDHTFKVWAQDAAGNQDATAATRTWTITDTGTGTGGGTTPLPSPPAPPPPPPVPPPAPPEPLITAAFRTTGAKTSFSALAVRNAAAGSTVKLTCKGRGCPLRSRTFPLVHGKANLLKPLKRKRLRAGTVIEIRVTGPAGHLKLVRYKTRRGKSPVRTIRCAPPGGRLASC